MKAEIRGRKMTMPGTAHPDAWHRELDGFMESHKGEK